MRNALKRGTTFVSLFLFALPVAAFASVSITEVMYDAEGADTKHEWVEIRNEGSATDFSEWKLFEGGTNHKLTIFSGSPTVPSGGYAILADDAVTFLADYPSFSGIVFDTAFTSGLSNSGEALTLRDAALVDKDTTTYNTSLGAGGDGNSLQKVGSSWTASTPTPGASNGSVSTPPPEEEEAPVQTGATVSTPPNQQTASAPVEPQIRALAGDDRNVIAGASRIFSGVVVGIKGEPIQNARFVWTFGNGDSREGQSVLYAFPFPGKYVVTLDVVSGAWSATDRLVVTATAAEIALTAATHEYIEIENQSKDEVDIGLWQLAASGKTFIFPARTVLLPKTKVRISTPATGLAVMSPNDVSLLYPNGTYAAGYRAALFLSSEPAGRNVSAPVSSAPAPQEENPETLPEAPEGSVLGVATEVSEPLPYAVWFGALLAIIGAGWGAAYFIRKKFSSA